MSFFDKVKASVGIGAVKVDTQLEKASYRPGEVVKGTVRMVGGNVEQTVNAVTLQLMTEVKKEGQNGDFYGSQVLQAFHVSSGFQIQKGEQKEIPFSFTLPLKTPVTLSSSKVWIHTELDIPLAVDQKDKDFISVEPSPAYRIVNEAMEHLGFQIRKIDCEYTYTGIVQEFEFYPYNGKFNGYLDEVELVFNVASNGVNLRLQVDRRARGLGSLIGEALNMDETHTRIFVSNEELNKGILVVAKKLEEIISKFARY